MLVWLVSLFELAYSVVWLVSLFELAYSACMACITV